MTLTLSDLIAAPGWNLSMLMMLAKATLILVAALGITLAMQRASAGSRHLVWLVTLGALLLVPALSAWGPFRMEILPAISTASSSAPDTKDARTTDAAAITMNGAQAANTAAEASTISGTADHVNIESESASAFGRIASLNGLSAVIAIWAAVVALILASLGYGALIVRRIVRGARPLDTQDWLTPLWEVSDRLELEEPPRLLRSEEAKMPFACGLINPTIVLPADCDTWTLDRRRAVLLHELAHVRRHDLMGHTLGRLACAVYWFHPLVWTAAKQLRAESERACDDLALACGARASDYAEHLLDIVTSVRHDRTPAVALAMARRKEFEGRMLAILDPELRHSGPGKLQAAGLIASLALISIAVGAAAPAPRASAQVSTATSQAPVGRPLDQVDASRSSDQVDPSIEVDVKSAVKTAMDDEMKTETGIDPKVDIQANAATIGSAVGSAVSTAVVDALQAPVAKAMKEAFTDPIARIIEGSAGRASQAKRDDRPVLLANVLRTDTSATLRRVAAWGLAEYAETQVGADALSSALRRDSNAGVREMAAWALSQGDEGNPTVTEALSVALRNDASARVRGIAAWALGNVGDRDAVGALTAALNDSDPSVKRRAAWSLGRVEPREAPRQLVDMLRDKDPKVRELTAWSLYQIRDRNTVAALDAALRSEPDKELQFAYIRALAAIGEHSVDAIRKLLDSPDHRIKTMAVQALAGRNAGGPWPWPWPEPRPYP
ncbi:MAG TPA: M56 family metallopeptidase [Gemmatimonadaceae bacterium]|nr:M56 family metallopeptidase [Gemmatimonadaceae bacterium]